MSRLRRDTRHYKRHALDSLILAIELFNRPHNTLRTEGVLIFLQHAFEMLFKAAIYQTRRTVHEPRSNITYRFDKCLAISHSDLNILSEDDLITLSILDGCRDCAMHHLIDLSEQSLYIHSQSAISIFDNIFHSVFNERLADYLPSRVLPISTNPPTEMSLFMDSEFQQINSLIASIKRNQSEAKARLRQYLIMETALRGRVYQPKNSQISSTIKRMKKGENWRSIFQGVASLSLDTSGHGLTYSIRFTRNSDAAPVLIVRDDEEVEDVTLVRELDMLDIYSLNLSDLAEKCNIGRNKLLALIEHLNIKSNPECYKEFHRKSLILKTYSPKALEMIKEALPQIDIDQIWKDYCALKYKSKTIR